MDNKSIFANNLKRYMKLNDKSRKDISEALGISYYTVTDWVKGTKYPRMDKVEKLAQYFGVLKSDLIEEKNTPQREERTPEGERHQKYEEIFDLFEGISESRAEFALKGMLYFMNIPDEKLPEAVRYLQFLSENAEN